MVVNATRRASLARLASGEEQPDAEKPVRAYSQARKSIAVSQVFTEGPSIVQLNKKVVGKIFDSMREAADADMNSPRHCDNLLPFSHLQVHTMGGLGKLRTERGQNFRRPKWWKYLAVLSQLVCNLMNLWMLLRSFHGMLLFLSGLTSIDEDSIFTGHIQVGFLTAKDRQHLVYCFEGTGLLWYTFKLARAVVHAQSTADEGSAGLRRWEAHASIYWELLPALRSFSALRMLRRVHPQLLPMEFSALWKYLQVAKAPARSKLISLILFVGHRVMILYFGFQAFIFKFTLTARRLEAATENPMWQLVVSFAFLNQLLGGILQLEKLLRNRLMFFLFGGEDAHVDVEEDAIMHVWLACLARALHLEVTAEKAPWPQLRSIVTMCCFSHMDLQQIVLDEDSMQVDKRHTQLRQFSKGSSKKGNPEGSNSESEELSFEDYIEAAVSTPAMSHGGTALLRGD